MTRRLLSSTKPEAPAKCVVVLDTDPGVRWSLEKGLSKSGYTVHAVSTTGEALRLTHEGAVDAVVMELLPEAGLTQEFLETILATPSQPKVLCVSIDSSPQTVIDCVRRGAADFLPKPFGLAELRASLARALASEQEQKFIRRPERARPDDVTAVLQDNGTLLIGISHAMQELHTTIQQIARTDLNCLIRGESGTGKDMVAREIHRLSARSRRPFVKVNCTALPEQLLESELFGFEKGAFTGAVAAKPGRFELANGGIIFLDEIGDLQSSLQAKLLQVIEHKEFTKLGGRKHVHVDVQIIAATNADLEDRIRQGTFRDDLFFRLNEVSIPVPSLSERKEDIPLLIRHFVQKHGRFTGAEGLVVTGEDLAALTSHEWPGNVRELESAVKRWLALGRQAVPALSLAPSAGSPIPSPPSTPSVPSYPSSEWELAVAHAEKHGASGFQPPGDAPDELDDQEDAARILQALKASQWNRRKAAESLGITYPTLRRRIDKYGLTSQ